MSFILQFRRRLIALGLFFPILLAILWHFAWSPGTPGMVAQISIRRARPEDLDDITEAGMKGFALEKPWNWRFPHAQQFPEVHLKYSRQRFSDFMTSPNKLVMVAVAPSVKDPRTTKVVSVAIWQAPKKDLDSELVVKKPAKLPTDYFERPDCSPERLKEWRIKTQAGQKRFFDDVYGDSQLHLIILSTHPDYHRRGAGSMFSKWGMEKAKKEDLALVLTAGSMGQSLYTKLGFKRLGVVHCQVEGEDEFVELAAMVYNG